MTNTKMLRMK